MTVRAITLNKRERELARHALGLPNRSRQSYRNAYSAPHCSGSYDDWMRMVDKGAACKASRMLRGVQRFWLTRAGADAALLPNETLDPEDFPE